MTAPQSKVIVTCAITGGIHTPTMSPYLPITADEIAREAIAAAQAGASIVHLHARDPENGQPSQDPALFRAFLPVIAERSNMVINLTTGGAPSMLVEERLRPALQLKPEVASLNMGSMNFGLYPMLSRHKEFKYGWERPYLEGPEDRVFRNTFKESAISSNPALTTAPVSRSSATTPATCIRRRTSSIAAFSSRLASSSRSSACWVASARIRKT